MTKRRSNYDPSCWRNRSSLEVGLIGVVIAAVIFSIVLVILLTVKIPTVESPKPCQTQECLIEANRIVQRTDKNVNPCDDFYKFSCGNFLKNANGNEKLGAFLSLQEDVDRQLIELYSEPVRKDEHNAVTMAKKLFTACMDEVAIEEDGLWTIKETLRSLGGWPVVEGFNWDEEKFDWLEASYRLRERGFPFSIFLDLLVIPDPKDNNKYIFEVAIPIARNFFSSTDFQRKKFMTDVAVIFGANKYDALSEIEDITEFAVELQQRNYSSMHVEKVNRRFTLYEFNERYGYYMNWLEFINKIANGTTKISQNDFVVFPQLNILNNWFHLLSKTPKRIQANYMMWKVIEETIPYMTKNLQERSYTPKLMPPLIEKNEPRLKFCLREIQGRFSPSPINVIYARKYLTVEKKRQLEELVANIREEFMEVLNNVDWMEEKDKRTLVEKANEMVVITGAPDGYLLDKVLDDLNATEEPNGNTFLSLLVQANKNYKNGQYRKFIMTRQEKKLREWYLGTISDYIMYHMEDNVMRIPVTMLQGVFFNEHRPNYLNYGGIGVAVAYEFVNLFSNEAIQFDKHSNKIYGWSNQTRQAFERKTACTAKDFEDFKMKNNKLLAATVLRETLALKISYKAYNNWVTKRGEETELIATHYTPNQLFWIAAAFTTCQPTNLYNTIFRISEESDYFSFLVFAPMRNNPDFVQDFSCAVGSRMNPRDKCQM